MTAMTAKSTIYYRKISQYGNYEKIIKLSDSSQFPAVYSILSTLSTELYYQVLKRKKTEKIKFIKNEVIKNEVIKQKTKF